MTGLAEAGSRSTTVGATPLLAAVLPRPEAADVPSLGVFGVSLEWPLSTQSGLLVDRDASATAAFPVPVALSVCLV